MRHKEQDKMRYGQIVLGPPGSGKSTYCCTLQQYFQLTNRNCVVVNLDPANENISFDLLILFTGRYKCDINITELITLDDAMTTYSLGPNGGRFCISMLMGKGCCFVWSSF